MKKDNDLTEVVYEKIVNMIFKKELYCGEKIQEEKIAKILRVSRRRFSEVITLDDQYIKNLGLTRLFLDSLAIQLAILHGSNEDFLQLRELADQSFEAAKIGDTFNSIKKDCDFHLMLCKTGKNIILEKLQTVLYLKVRLVRTIRNKNIKENLKMVEAHYDILDKLFERNSREAVKCIQKHIVKFYNINPVNIENVIFSIDYNLTDKSNDIKQKTLSKKEKELT